MKKIMYLTLLAITFAAINPGWAKNGITTGDINVGGRGSGGAPGKSDTLSGGYGGPRGPGGNAGASKLPLKRPSKNNSLI